MMLYLRTSDKSGCLLISVRGRNISVPTNLLQRQETAVTTGQEAELDTKGVLDSVTRSEVSFPKGNQTLRIHDVVSRSAD